MTRTIHPILLSRDRIAALATLDGWVLADGVAREASTLHKRYRFPDFSRAMAFMAAAVHPIERLDHHPRWTNSHRTVDVWLTTHDNGAGQSGVTRLDLELAAALDDLAAR